MLGVRPERNKSTEEIQDEVEEVQEDIKPKAGAVKKQAPKSNNLNLVIGISVLVIAVIFVIGFITVKLNSKNANKSTTKETSVSANKSTKTPTPTEDNKVKAGVPNLGSEGSAENTKVLSNYTDFVKDLNGKEVAVDYKVKRIKTVTDFINYEKKRAVTGNGLELYWLEATYKDRPYRVQVPFQIWKELDTKGITVVDAEVLQLGNDSEIVSYMQVRADYKRLLERRN